VLINLHVAGCDLTGCFVDTEIKFDYSTMLSFITPTNAQCNLL